MSDLDSLDVIRPVTYAEHGYPHEAWARLRAESPVHWFEPEGYRGFWAITKHADICEISKQPEQFLNGPRLTIVSEGLDQVQNQGPPVRTIVNMDPPDHLKYRKVASPWFTPRNMKLLEERMMQCARELVDKLAAQGAGGESDFVTEVAAMHPLRLIAHIFGIPEEDEPFVLRVTNELFGAEDPEFRRDDDPMKAAAALGVELYTFFSKIIMDRKANPRDDLATVFANAQIDGQDMGGLETLGYYLIVLTAGHETTRNALSGGMLALLENPEELARLKRDPSLLPRAVDEIIRWTTPVNHFARTAVEDYELRGRTIRAGESVALFYSSANRDEEVFQDPFRFRVDRDPNPHLGFGIGEHFCLGANLARMEMRVLFEELLPRIEEMELAGEPERLASSFVGGVKHLPLRYTIAPERMA